MTWRGSRLPQHSRSPYAGQPSPYFNRSTPPDGQKKEARMARGRKARDAKDDSGEVKTKDFDKVERLYRGDIKPAKSEAASQMQAVGEAYKAVKKECHVRPDAVRSAIKTFELEDVHRDDFIESYVGTLNKLMGREVLVFKRDDLFANLEDDDDFEASEEELAAQKPRANAAERRAVQAELAASTH